MLRGKIGLSKLEVKKDRLCVNLNFFNLKNLKFTCLEIFLSLFTLQCKDYHCYIAGNFFPTARARIGYFVT